MILVQYTLIYASVLIFVALGGMFSERSGVINLGLEGTMVFGALGGAFVLYALPPETNGACVVSSVIAVGALSGMLFSLLLVVVKSFNNAVSGGTNPSAILEYIENRKAFAFKIGSLELSVYTVLTIVVLVLSFVVLYKNRFGLRLVSCGEHPQAADSVGINVYKMRYAGVLISGFLGGIGGIVYISAVNSQWDFVYGVAGAGFLALAVMIFGQWHPVRIALAALLFGVFRAVADTYSSFDFLVELVPGEAYKMLPYVISLVVLAFTSKKSRAPKAEGIPYDKSAR